MFRRQIGKELQFTGVGEEEVEGEREWRGETVKDRDGRARDRKRCWKRVMKVESALAVSEEGRERKNEMNE